MSIRIQPKRITVPEDDPFKYDLLQRKDQIDVLTNVVRNIEGPCTLAIDAPWGTGKTTFLDMWSQHLINLGFPTVNFNAWETDFIDDPFVALSEELTLGIENRTHASITSYVENLKQVSLDVARFAAPALIRIGTAGALDISPILARVASEGAASMAQERISAYAIANKSLRTFRSRLSDLAQELSTQRNGLPLIVFIDELDRCRPSYAVQLLEIAKHLFSVDHVVFVMALNREELAHSVSALYGINFDGSGYLNRFFDIDVRLADPDRRLLIESTLTSLNLRKFFAQNSQCSQYESFETVRDLLVAYLGTSYLGIRTIAQSMHRLGLLFASLRNDRRSFGLGAVTLLIIRTIDADLYSRFMRREISDFELVAAINDRLKIGVNSFDVNRALFEAIIAAGALELLNGNRADNSGVSTPLLAHYEQILKDPHPEDGSWVARESYANFVVSMAHKYCPRPFFPHVGFEISAKRIELLSNDLVQQLEKP